MILKYTKAVIILYLFKKGMSNFIVSRTDKYQKSRDILEVSWMIAGMKIGINFDDTITDTNYSMIDVINKGRKRADQIDFEDFDASECVSIWRYPELTLRERIIRHVYGGELLHDVDVVPMAVDCIQEAINAGVEVHILTSRTEDEREDVIAFLRRHRIRVEETNVHMNLGNADKIKVCMENTFDFYIEDNPAVISLGIRAGAMMVVRDQVYNRNYKNILRMECFSQLLETCERALLKRIRIDERKAAKLAESETEKMKDDMMSTVSAVFVKETE